MYAFGVIVLVVQLGYVLLPESAPAYVSRSFMLRYLGLCIAMTPARWRIPQAE